jgi:hypothetical protein
VEAFEVVFLEEEHPITKKETRVKKRKEVERMLKEAFGKVGKMD